MPVSKRSAAGSILFLLLLAGPPAAVRADEPRVFVGYVFGPPRNVNFGLYTHLCHAFVTADADGNLKPNRLVPDKVFAAEARKHGVEILVSLGGFGWDEQFAAMVEKPEAERRYVDSVMKLVEEAGYDGIDLDWEYPDTKKEVVGFERLVRTFRRRLDELGAKRGRRMLVTMAASANPGTLSWLRKDFVVETMDWVNVMTYDMAGPWTAEAGHHSPLFASSKIPGGRRRSTAATIEHLIRGRGFPPGKLALGIPLYGRAFNVAEPYAPTKDAPKGNLPRGNYENLSKLAKDRAWTYVWDDETKTPWLVSASRKQVVGYDDARSAALKTEWANAEGLRGVFFWQVAADRLPDGSNPLQEASRKAWAKGGSKSP